MWEWHPKAKKANKCLCFVSKNRKTPKIVTKHRRSKNHSTNLGQPGIGNSPTDDTAPLRCAVSFIQKERTHAGALVSDNFSRSFWFVLWSLCRSYFRQFFFASLFCVAFLAQCTVRRLLAATEPKSPFNPYCFRPGHFWHWFGWLFLSGWLQPALACFVRLFFFCASRLPTLKRPSFRAGDFFDFSDDSTPTPMKPWFWRPLNPQCGPLDATPASARIPRLRLALADGCCYL